MSQFRPTVESLERRDNPAINPLDVHVSAAYTEYNAQVMQFITENPGYASNTDLQPLGQATALIVIQRSQIDSRVLQEFLDALRANVAADPMLAPTLQSTIDKTAALVAQTEANRALAQGLFSYITLLNPDLAPDPSTFIPPTTDPVFVGDGATDPLGGDQSLIDPNTLFNPDGTINQDAVNQATGGTTV